MVVPAFKLTKWNHGEKKLSPLMLLECFKTNMKTCSTNNTSGTCDLLDHVLLKKAILCLLKPHSFQGIPPLSLVRLPQLQPDPATTSITNCIVFCCSTSRFAI